MKKFRKQPVIIEAVQITEDTFDAPHPNAEHVIGVEYDPVERCVYIDTLEGRMRGNVGDWIIRGVKGELYPCKADIFEASYMAADEGSVTNVPGLKACHAVVTPVCRTNHSPNVAMNIAVERLRRAYLELLNDQNARANFHFVMTVERPLPDVRGQTTQE